MLSVPSPNLRRRQKSPAPVSTPSLGPHRSGPRVVSTRPTVARGGLPEGLTFSRSLARLQLRASRLQGHFGTPGARLARIGGSARQPANLRLKKERGKRRLGRRRARPCTSIPGFLTGLPRIPWPPGAQPPRRSPRRHRRTQTSPVLGGASRPEQGLGNRVPEVGGRGGRGGKRETH